MPIEHSEPLIQVNTNAGKESSGMTSFLGVEIEGKWFMLPGSMIIVGIGIFILLFKTGANLFLAAVFSGMPLILSLLYLTIFIIGRPPHYQADFIEHLIHGPKYPYTVPHGRLFPVKIERR